VSLLQVTNLTIGFPTRPRVVDGVSLSIEAGEVIGVSGPSGCGKTTLALSLMGLLPSDTDISGSITFGGRELREMPESDLEAIRGAQIGLVFQESALALNPVLTVGGQIADVVRAHERCSGAQATERARAALADVGFGDERNRVFGAYPHELSGGQRQRILIAQATVCRPALVIADEPVASLDDASRADVLALIRGLSERFGTSFLLITHSAEVLASTADRVIEMNAGKVVDGTRPARAASVSLAASRMSKPTPIPGATEPIVEIIGLEKSYRRRRLFGTAEPAIKALNGIDLSIARGSTVGLAGRSGCGKSTLARCIAALEKADAGEIRINGTDIMRLGDRALRSYRNQVQIIFQDSAAALNPRFTALDIVSEAMVIKRIGTAAQRRDLSAELMTQVGLSPDRLQSRPSEFSGGERQRLAIARALAVSPRLLILDEAFSGLDVVTRERIVRLLIELQATHGLTYLCISHDIDLLARFATDTVVMHEGRIGAANTCVMPEGAVA
jgi:peptide/nickel transport system ATP-binding protein